MVRFIKGFFMILGAIFFVLLIVVGVSAYRSGWSPAALLSIPGVAVPQGAGAATGAAPAADAHPYLSASQETTLRAVGINPATLPASLTDTQRTCLLAAVGEARAKEILAGSAPTVTELFKAKGCL